MKRIMMNKLNITFITSDTFININASLWSIGTVGELSAVLSVSISVVTRNAVTVVASFSVGWSADGHCVALVSTVSAWTFMLKTHV